MTLRVKISKDERNAMRKYYKDCGLMRDAVTQLESALEEETGYVVYYIPTSECRDLEYATSAAWYWHGRLTPHRVAYRGTLALPLERTPC